MDTERQHRSSEASAIRRIRDGDTHRATLGAWARNGPLRSRDPSRQASTHKTGLSSPPTVPVNPFCRVRQVRCLRRFRAGPFRAQRAWRGGRTASGTIAYQQKRRSPPGERNASLYSTDLSDLNGISRSRRSFTASGPPSGIACLPACISPRRHPWHSRPACVPPRRPSTRAVEMHHHATPSPLRHRRLRRTPHGGVAVSPAGALAPLPDLGGPLLEPAVLALRATALIPQDHRAPPHHAVHLVQHAPAFRTQRHESGRWHANLGRLHIRRAHIPALQSGNLPVALHGPDCVL